MQGLPAIAESVVILNIVMDQRGFVKGLNGQGGSADRIRKCGSFRGQRARPALKGVESGQGYKRPRTLASLGEPIVGDRLVNGQRIFCRSAVGRTIGGSLGSRPRR